MGETMELSVIILAKNDEAILGNVLNDLSWATERIVVDNGSEDKTKEIAKKAGARVIEIVDHDFAKLRNVGAKAAKYDWLLYVDTDEEIPHEVQQEIEKKIASFEKNNDPHAYVLQRKNYYLGHPWPYIDGMIRLIYKPSLKGWIGKLHETAIITGNVGTLLHPCIHRTHRSFEDMVTKTNEWSRIEAELRFRNHHPNIVVWRLLRVMVTGFFDSYIKQGGWKAGTVGLLESMYQGFSMFITYAKLWEMQQK